LLTIEAQNAFLKVLEEPPVHTYIFLLSDTREALLPTILSRCFLIDLGSEELQVTDAEKIETEHLLSVLSESNIGTGLKAAEQLSKNKDDALRTIERLLVISRVHLLNNVNNDEDENAVSNQKMIKALQSLHRTIKTTNVNLRLALENFFLA
jgi:DNA polymerase III gamma/tau subunit